MINFKIKIADIVIEINAFNESTKKYCEGFLSNEDSDLTFGHLFKRTLDDGDGLAQLFLVDAEWGSETDDMVMGGLSEQTVFHHLQANFPRFFAVNGLRHNGI